MGEERYGMSEMEELEVSFLHFFSICSPMCSQPFEFTHKEVKVVVMQADCTVINVSHEYPNAS